MTVIRAAATIALLLAAAGAASAHPGEVAGAGFVTGLEHPIAGLDHLAAMIAVGLWGASLGNRAVWVLPVAFPLVMALGSGLAVAGTALPTVETGIAASALVIGLMVALAVRPPLVVSGSLVALFAFFHGIAHGAEMPAAASPAAYAVGFLLGTAMLHLTGIALGLLGQWPGGRSVVRACGGLIALAGLGFLTGAM